MRYDALAAAASLSNADLLARLQLLAARTREDTAEMVAHLAELEARGVHLAEGYGSLFVYCTTALRLSEHESYNRVVAAKAARAFPLILDGLADGSLNLTTVRLLAPLITAENHRDLLARAAGLSKRQVEALVASLAPKPDIVSHIRRLPAVNPAEMNHAETIEDTARLPVGPPLHSAPPPGPTTDVAYASSGPAVPAFATAVPQPRVGHTAVAPLSATRYRLQCTISEGAHADLRLAQDLLRRQIPDGDPGAIIERALALLVARIAKEKTAVVSMTREETAATSKAREQMAATSVPGPARSATPGSRHIPAAVRRAVWLRDRGQCAFVARQGRRCAERAFLELHHIRPFALGGEATVSNISLRCRRHNAYEAQMEFSSRTLGKTGRAIAPVGVG